ncbi:DNA-binding protein [Candidatus Woesearchaeota archaeon]|nr:DNA-binding protein [Candidatus Woesearchaeota archaeon]
MEIKDLHARMGNVDLALTIAEKGDVRTFEKFGKSGRVCTAVAEDATGKISLTLWNDDVDKANAGDKIQIKNGWVGEYQGELQLSTGKFGTLEVLEKGAVQPQPEQNEQKDVPRVPERSEEEPFTDEEVVDDEE